MASIQRYSVKGHIYWRIVESRRINGKPRAIPIMHLGTAATLLERLRYTESVCVRSYQHGDIAALVALAQELDLIALINRHVPRSVRGVSAGEALFLIAVNRLLAPCSKRGFCTFAVRTSLPRFFPKLPLEKLTSQFFWEQMRAIPEKALVAIEDELVRRTIKLYEIELDLLSFDTTNCFTYVHDNEDASELLQYGRSKEKRDDKLLFGVALLVARRGIIPLYHHTFPGNAHDSKQFPAVVRNLCSRLERLGHAVNDVTLVFDRGNNSAANFKTLDAAKIGFVAALRLGDTPYELFELPLQHSTAIRSGEHKGLQYNTTTLNLWGAERRVILYRSDRVKMLQVRALEERVAQVLTQLEEWNNALVNQGKGSDSSVDPVSAKKRISALLQGQYLKEILHISYEPRKSKNERLQFRVDEKKKADLINKYFGKRCLVTNRLNWSARDIIDTYFNQAVVEQAFRDSKDSDHIALRPQFHWTDHNIRVHVFSCFLALLLGRILLHKVRTIDESLSLSKLLDTLSSVRLAATINKAAAAQKNPQFNWKLEEMDQATAKLFEHLVPNRTPLWAS